MVSKVISGVIPVLVAAGAAIPEGALACPAYFNLDAGHAWIGKIPLSTIHLYSYEPKAGWLPLSLQIVPVSDDLSIDTARISQPGKQGAQKQTDTSITSRDRLVFEVSGFKGRFDGKAALPCGGQELVELQKAGDGGKQVFAYLVACTQHPSAEFEPRYPVTGNPAKREISSSEFVYQYHPRNELLYESLNAKTSSGAWVRSAYEAEITIRLDIKRFFTLEFNNEDIESYVMASTAGPVGFVEGISFYLRLLAFKIDLKMSTIASFFEKSANIPMVIDVPRNAPENLHPGSGSLYSFKLDRATFDPGHPQSNMPVQKAGTTLVEHQEKTRRILEQCPGVECRFRLMGKLGEDPIALDMILARNIVEMGFFPNLVLDVVEFRKAGDWKKDGRADGSSRGVYFETSGLAKGRYAIDTWILFGKDVSSETVCPAKVVTTGQRFNGNSRQ